MRCTEKGDVRTHLDNLRAAHAELATVGVRIDNDEYASIILKSLPSVYSNHLASVSAAAHLAGVTLTPATVMSLVLEEYYRQTGNNTQKGKDKESKETALTAQAGGGKANGQKGKKRDGKGQKKEFTRECFNCGGTGHRTCNCPSPKQEKAKNSQPGSSSKDSRNGSKETVAAADEKEPDGIWSAFANDEFWADLFKGDALADCTTPTTLFNDNDDLPSLQSVSDSESDGDDSIWLSEAEESRDNLPELVMVKGDESDVDSTEALYAEAADRDPDHEPVEHAAAMINGERTDLYDSGATRHMSPYRDEFTAIREIAPRSVNCGNQQTFEATGIGELIINVPNHGKTTEIQLTGVLYSPQIGFTLVSIGKIDDAGYSATFGGGICTIHDSDDDIVGVIVKTQGLYKVARICNEAHNASTKPRRLTAMELHRRMGHIAPVTTTRLVQKGYVTGIELDALSESTFCESCVHAKSRRAPIAHARDGN